LAFYILLRFIWYFFNLTVTIFTALVNHLVSHSKDILICSFL